MTLNEKQEVIKALTIGLSHECATKTCPYWGQTNCGSIALLKALELLKDLIAINQQLMAKYNIQLPKSPITIKSYQNEIMETLPICAKGISPKCQQCYFNTHDDNPHSCYRSLVRDTFELIVYLIIENEELRTQHRTLPMDSNRIKVKDNYKIFSFNPHEEIIKTNFQKALKNA